MTECHSKAPGLCMEAHNSLGCISQGMPGWITCSTQRLGECASVISSLTVYKLDFLPPLSCFPQNETMITAQLLRTHQGRVFQTISPSVPPDMLPFQGISPFSFPLSCCWWPSGSHHTEHNTSNSEPPSEATASPVHLWCDPLLSQFNAANLASSKTICIVPEQRGLWLLCL